MLYRNGRRVRDNFRLARRFAAWVHADPDFELVAPVGINEVCFRALLHGLDAAARDALNADLLARVNATGEVLLSSTSMGGCFALRLAVGNLRTTVAQIERAWEVVGDAFRGILVDRFVTTESFEASGR